MIRLIPCPLDVIYRPFCLHVPSRSVQLVKPGLGFGSFHTARRTLKGYEAMTMIGKGQIKDIDRDDVTGPIAFIHEIFGIAA